MAEFLTEVSEPIRYAGPGSDDPLTFRWYDADRGRRGHRGRLHLVGGGARSPAYRQVTADCGGVSVRVPDPDEAVATGACVQAALCLGMGLADTADAWGLGAGPDVEPAPDASTDAVRSAYRQATQRPSLRGRGPSGP